MHLRSYKGGYEQVMKAFIIDVEFVWGFQSRIAGLSKTNPSFYYPPPSTFLGAIAEVLAKDYGVGEDKGKDLIPALSSKLLAIGVRPINCIPIKYEDLNRIIAIKLTSGTLYPSLKSHKHVMASFDSPARGKTILSSLNNESPKLRWFIVFKDIVISDEIVVSSNHLWKIHRLGSKESVVSVSRVKEVNGDELITSRKSRETVMYSFQVNENVNLLEEVEPKWESEIYVDPFSINEYSESNNPVTDYISGEKLVRYMIPIRVVDEDPKYLVELTGDLVAYKFDGEAIIGWR